MTAVMNGIFPKWNPQQNKTSRFDHNSFKAKYKALRNSSFRFTARHDVHQFIFRKNENLRTLCKSCNGGKLP